MTDDNSNLVDMDLDAFEADFYQKPDEITIEEEKVEDTGDDGPATDEDTDAEAPTSDEDQETDEDSDEKEDSEPEDEDEKSEDKDEEKVESEKKVKGKKSAQERINEITRRAKEAERANAQLLARLEALESRETEVTKKEPIAEKLPQGAPSPDAVDETGEPLYPLGEFDPLFIRDLTKFTIAEETRVQREEATRQAEAQRIAAAKEELRTEWNQKLDKVEEEVPEIREHIVDLVETFKDLEPAYGEYIAMTIMQSENGPYIMEYLSQNIGEAQKIVASGPAAATLAIGRLDARLAKVPEAEEKRNPKKVSHAPEPPEMVTRGRKGQASVRPDTDDLDAFEREYYKK